jgi:hypothetical protein
VRARRFDSAGAPVGAEFQVNTYTGGHQVMPVAAFQQGGGFVVAWHGTQQDGSASGVFAQRYSASGAPLGGEFRVNGSTAGIQAFPCVGGTANGGFVIGWVSANSDNQRAAAVRIRRFDADGNPLGLELPVSAGTPVQFARHACSLAADADGGFAVAWTSASVWDEGDSGSAHIRRYDGEGRPIGPRITMQESNKVFLSTTLAANGAGRLAIGWSEGRHGADAEVKGRLYVFPPGLALDDTDDRR